MLTAKSGPATTIPNVGARPELKKADDRAAKPLSQIIVDGVITITPELAWRIIQEAPYAKQRPIRKAHVDALAMQMRRHEWTGGTQIHFGRVKSDDPLLALVNGNHRMHAVIKADTAISFQALVSEVETAEGLDRLYRRHDRLVAPRSVQDALRAEGTEVQYDLQKGFAAACFRALPMIESGFQHIRTYADPYLLRSDEARLRLAEPWWPVAKVIQDATLRGHNTRFVKAAGVMAVALVTMRYQEMKAFPFWQGVASGDRLARDDPRFALIHAFQHPRLRTEVNSAKSTSAAWNAFFRDEPLTIVRVTAGPVRLLGTPFEKG
jgi:hypothetical protein